MAVIDIYRKDFDSEDARHHGKVARWRSVMNDRIVAMARAAPEQQEALAKLALQSLDEWNQLVRSCTPMDEANEYVCASRAAINSLHDLRVSMLGKPTSLKERNTNDPDEIETWRLYNHAFDPVVQLAGCLVGFTKETERVLQEMVAESDRRRAAEQARETKSGFWSKLKFWLK